MNQVKYINKIISEITKCPYCKANIVLEKCEIAVYLSKKKKKIIDYCETDIYYCKNCVSYFLSDKEIKEIIPYQIKIFNKLPEWDKVVSLFHVDTNKKEQKPNEIRSSKNISTKNKGKKYNIIEIKSLLTEVYIHGLFRTISCEYYAIVENELEEDVDKNILSKSNEYAKKILTSLAYGKNNFMFEKVRHNIKWYENSDYIKQSKILKEIYVYFGDINCFIYEHEYKNVTASVLCENSDVVKINVLYCSTCKKYCIDIHSYHNYQSRYGDIIIELRYDNKIHYDNKSGYYLSYEGRRESLLYMLGYNTVLTESQRHMKLVSIIECGKMEKAKIIRHLHFLLKRNRNNFKHIYSVPKWESDLEFINNYDINRQDEIYGTIIMKVKSLGLHSK